MQEKNCKLTKLFRFSVLMYSAIERYNSEKYKKSCIHKYDFSFIHFVHLDQSSWNNASVYGAKSIFRSETYRTRAAVIIPERMAH